MSDQEEEKTRLVLEWIQNLDRPTLAGASVPVGKIRTGSKSGQLTLGFVPTQFSDNVWQSSHPLVIKSATVTSLKPYQPEPIVTGDCVEASIKLNDLRRSSAYVSEEFEAGGSSWRMLFMPHGHPNNSTAEDCSFYLERVAELSETHKVAVCAQFALAVYHYPTMNPYHFEYTHARFTNLEPLHGFRNFCDADILFPPALGKSSTDVRPILENGRGTIMAFVRVLDDPSGSLAKDYFGKGSRKRTGYTGLRSDRHSPCLSSVVQMLFALSPIRQAPYKIVDDGALDTSETVVGELISIFEELRDRSEPAVLSRLQRLLKMNVQEQLHSKDILLMYDTLLKELVATLGVSREAEIINRLFEGKTREHTSLFKSDCLIDTGAENTITSSSVCEGKATRICPVRQDTSIIKGFHDLCFDIKGKVNLRDLLSHHTRDAKEAANPFVQKRSVLLAFPPVLRIQLTYPTSDEEAVFLDLPEVVDFAEWIDPVAVACDSEQSWVYHLHAVVRHDQRRDLYHTFINHGRGNDWLRFSEEIVDVANPGEGEGRVCFLSYVRESLMDVILKRDTGPWKTRRVKKKTVEERTLRTLSSNAALKMRRSVEVETRSREHLYEKVDIMSDESFTRHTGFDITYFGNYVKHCKETWKTIYVLHLEPFDKFQRRLARFYGIPEGEVQVWLVAPTAQHNPRMVKLITTEKSQDLVSDFLDMWPNKSGRRKKLYIRAKSCVATSKRKVLVMLKAFDIQKGTFLGLNSVEHDPSHRVSSLVPLFVDALSWAATAYPVIYKESGWKINPLLPSQTLEQLSFTDGTCVCVLVDQGQPFKDYDLNRDYGVGVTQWGDLWHVDRVKLQGRVIGSIKEKPREL